MSSGYRNTATWLGSEDIVPALQSAENEPPFFLSSGQGGGACEGWRVSELALPLLSGPACAESLFRRKP